MNIDQKNALVAACHRHRDADMLARGDYATTNDAGDFRGCSVGCLAHDLGPVARYGHEEVAAHYGYPEWLVRLQDALFENASMDVHVLLAEAMRPRVDGEWPQVMHAIHWRILNEITLPHAGDAESVVREVMRLHEQREPTESAAWSAARSAAESAASSAASSAAWSAAWSAARSAAESAARSAASSAARSAAWSAAWSAARSAAWAQIMSIALEEVAA